MTTIAGYAINDKERFLHWRLLCDAWIKVHERFIAVAGDAAYWYTERSNLGILAAAAWSINMVALEEYQVKKLHAIPGIKHKDELKNGRCDLLICSTKTHEVIEAKLRWLYLRSQKPEDIFTKAIHRATADVRKTIGNDGHQGAGVVFFPIYVNVTSTSPREMATELSEFIESLNARNPGVLAWCFPHKSRGYKGENKKNYLPGVVMAVQST